MQIRTDLAAELREAKMKERAERDAGELDGVKYSERTDGDISVSMIDIISDAGAEKLGRPCGRYVTVSFPDVVSMGYDEYERVCRTVSENIASLCRAACPDMNSVLVCGLGNRHLASDAVGVITAERTVVTRHIKNSDEDVFNAAGFFNVSALTPGVSAQTGIETLELIKGAINEAKPDVLIVVDALAARMTERLARTVQLCDTGISPGSGVGNHRAAINRESVGIPVISVGVPTVIDCATLVFDALAAAGVDGNVDVPRGMFVCPKDIDARAELVGGIIGYAINLAFHKNMTVPEMMIM